MLQRFLYRTQDVPVADRAQLQQDILDLVRAHGAVLAAAACCCAWRMGCCAAIKLELCTAAPASPCADMAPLYEEVCSELGVAKDAAALSEMRERNTKQLAELQDKIKDAGGQEEIIIQSLMSLQLAAGRQAGALWR